MDGRVPVRKGMLQYFPVILQEREGYGVRRGSVSKGKAKEFSDDYPREGMLEGL